MKDSLHSKPGTYILVIKVNNLQTIRVGKIGLYSISKGYYLYVGSAHGPGGIRSRILRHLTQDKIKHWHIDYLNNAGTVAAILISYSKKKKECTWASRLNSSTLPTPINGFGASDCSCPSHLFFCGVKFNLKLLKSLVKDNVEFFRLP